MRLVLHNPHTNIVFAKTVQDYLLRIFTAKKYTYILEYLIREKKQFVIYYDGHDSSFNLVLQKLIHPRVEIFIWMMINNINPFRTTVIYNLNKIKETDIFFSFSLRNLDRKYSGIDNIANKKFLKIFHITHFVQNTSLIATNAKRLNIDYFVAENNLSRNSDFFKKCFNFYKKNVYILPFIAQERFVRNKAFKDRLNKCLATGTLVNISHAGNPRDFKDFRSFYHTEVLQPIRNEIYKHKVELEDIIDSSIGELYEKKLKRTTSVSIGKQILVKFYNAFFSTKRQYFKFDIVDRYNSYKMFINGEEINDLPGIGFVEGMACGSAYIGQVNSMYTDIGLKPGIHYIGYNGSLEDLKKKITYYQGHPKELEKIANAGYQFVRKNLTGTTVAEKFYHDLENLSKKYKKNNFTTKGINDWCSFVT